MSSNSVDAILQRLITDAKNLDPDVDVSQGTETYLRFAATASAIWGAYKHLDWTLDQIFPTTASQESLEQFAANRGFSIGTMTPAELLSYIISRLRKPPAGGKLRDFERWALEASSTGRAISLTASMLSSATAGFSAANMIVPHDPAIGMRLDESHVGTVVLTLDLGSAQSLFGLGLGTYTSRRGTFEIASADSVDGPWTVRGSVSAGYWWRMSEFEPASARYWRLRLASLSALSTFAVPAQNNLTLYGIECYSDAATIEQATTASGLMNYYGVGTMLTVLQPTTLSMRMCEAVRNYQESQGPVAPRDLRVMVPAVASLRIRIVVTGTLSSEASFRLAVSQYVAGLSAGALFVCAQLVVYAMQYGANNAVPYISVNGADEMAYPATLQAEPTQIFTLASLSLESA